MGAALPERCVLGLDPSLVTWAAARLAATSGLDQDVTRYVADIDHGSSSPSSNNVSTALTPVWLDDPRAGAGAGAGTGSCNRLSGRRQITDIRSNVRNGSKAATGPIAAGMGGNRTLADTVPLG